jgi:hypothetical protein
MRRYWMRRKMNNGYHFSIGGLVSVGAIMLAICGIILLFD